MVLTFDYDWSYLMTNMRVQICQIISDNYQFGNKSLMETADAILTALPSMIAPLVWEGEEDDCFVHSEAAGYTYELSVCDTLERSCDYVWRSDVRYMGKTEVNIATKSTAPFAEAQDAANTHHRASIMAAFTGATSK
jgi:hypothetical protein